MKTTAIIAMLVVFALVAAPLMITNAKAETIDDPAVIDTIGVDWVIFVAPDISNEIHGADWDYRVYGDANGYIIMASPNTEIHGEDGGIAIQSKGFSSLIRSIIGGEIQLTSDDGGAVIFVAPDINTEIHGEDGAEPARMNGKIALCNADGNVFMVCNMDSILNLIRSGNDGVPSGQINDESKGFSSLIRSIIGGEIQLDSDVPGQVYRWPIQDVYTITGEDGAEPAGMNGKIVIFLLDDNFDMTKLDSILNLIR